MRGKNIPNFILDTNKSKTLTYRQFPAKKMGGRQIAMFQLNFHPPKPTLVKLVIILCKFSLSDFPWKFQILACTFFFIYTMHVIACFFFNL